MSFRHTKRLQMEPDSGGVTLPRMATRIHFHTADELAQLLATVIAGVAGGTAGRWRRIIGHFEKLPTWNNVHCNWRIAPGGNGVERAEVEQAAAIVRAEHPYIESQREKTKC